MNRRLASIVAGVAFLLLILPPARALDEIAIHQIQFTADPSGVSPFSGRTITTGGIVTSLYPTGYSIQEPLSGPWSGIFVEDSARRPILGNFVVLSARVVEEKWYAAGMETFLIGGAAAAIAYIVGYLLKGLA